MAVIQKQIRLEQQQIAEYQEKLQLLESEKRLLRREHESLEQSSQRMVGVYNKEIEHLKQSLESQLDANSNVITDLRIKEDEFNSLKTKVSHLQSEVEGYQESNQKLNEFHQRSRQPSVRSTYSKVAAEETATYIEAIGEMQRKVLDSENLLNSQRLEQYKSEHATRNEKQLLQFQVETLEKQASQYNKTNDQFKARNQELQQRIIEMQSQISDYQIRESDKQAEITRLNTMIQAIQSSVENARRSDERKLSCLEGILLKNREEMARIETSKFDTEKLLKSIQEQLYGKEKQLRSRMAELGEMQQQKRSLMTELEQLRMMEKRNFYRRDETSTAASAAASVLSQQKRTLKESLSFTNNTINNKPSVAVNISSNFSSIFSLKSDDGDANKLIENSQ